MNKGALRPVDHVANTLYSNDRQTFAMHNVKYSEPSQDAISRRHVKTNTPLHSTPSRQDKRREEKNPKP
ncbi:hypothetical protein BHE90_015454 [Fusarium euwallaceae]|uniref:Uncharacterized protein n=1 Tax=Fusarium euwallaceae TaxID=1147111 RepID=A0A430L341_9HYPO|nr:hypothetical protein BHE90_015454 [Fusarium euwallaceae]